MKPARTSFTEGNFAESQQQHQENEDGLNQRDGRANGTAEGLGKRECMSNEGSRHTEDNGEKQGVGFEKRSPRERALEFRSHENSFVKS